MAKSFGWNELLLLAVAIVWGTSYGLAKEALIFYPVLGFLAVRFLVTAIVMAPSFYGLGRARALDVLRTGVPLGFILLSIFVAETYGLAMTTASNAAFLISTCVVLTPIVEFFALGTRPTSNVIWAILLSLAGAYLISLKGDALSFNPGDMLILLAALLRACMVTFTKRMTLDSDMSSMALTAVQTGVVGLGALSFGVLLLPQGLPALPTDPKFWLITLYMIAFCTLFAFFAQNYAVRKTSPTRVSMLMGTEPVFGALFAVLWLGESAGPLVWMGGAMIVIASVWGTIRPAVRVTAISSCETP